MPELFSDREISTQDGSPIALYLIEWGEVKWAYTSADRDVTYGGITYEAVAISDSGMVQGGQATNDFTVDCPRNIPIVELFRGTPPSDEIWLTVRRLHQGDEDAPIYWTGAVSNVKSQGPASARLVGIPLTASFRRTGLRLCWTKECPHFLYDHGCKVDPELFRNTAEVVSMTTTSVTVDSDEGREDGYFRGGYIEWEVEIGEDTATERRMVESHVGNVIGLLGLSDRLQVGTTIRMYPGCDRTPTMCINRFDNLKNYGGFDFMPGETPFGTIVF